MLRACQRQLFSYGLQFPYSGNKLISSKCSCLGGVVEISIAEDGAKPWELKQPLEASIAKVIDIRVEMVYSPTKKETYKCKRTV